MVMKHQNGRNLRSLTLTIRNQLAENQMVVQMLKENLAIARNRMKHQVDQHR
jgi:hypothetical protein